MYLLFISSSISVSISIINGCLYLLLYAFFWVNPLHIKSRHRGITQKKAYKIQNTAEV
jgi:hypothetical protein